MSALFAVPDAEHDDGLSERPLLDVLDAIGADVEESDDMDAGPALPMLPPAFWDVYPELSKVRDYAHHHAAFPEPLLVTTMARAAALVRRGTVVDTGMLNPVPLNLFAGLVGVSGRGKSASIGLARRFLPYDGERWQVAESTGQPEFVERGLGSGEGIVEAFMGHIVDRAAVGEKGGRPPRVRMQVRHNALLTADEGGFLVAALSRQGASLGPLLREAWGSSRMGQQNGSTDTSRDVAEHCLGVIVGFQPTIAAQLFGDADAEVGMPQRFLWVPTRSAWPDEKPADPGPLDDWEPPPFGTVLRPPARVCEALYDEYRSDTPAPILDSQRPAMLCKLAGLLAVLRRDTQITETDWELAEALYELNRHVRSALRDHAAERARREQDRTNGERAASAVRTRVAVDSAHTTTARAARKLHKRIARLVAAEGRGATRRDLSRALTGAEERAVLDAALRSLILSGEVVELEERDGYWLGEGDVA